MRDDDLQERITRHLFEVLSELRVCVTRMARVLPLYEELLPDGAGPSYREALVRLRGAAPVMLPGAVHQALAHDLGPDWSGLFRSFADRPVALATHGQVHRAVWHDGREVAVKIQFPGARQALAHDLGQLDRLSPLAAVLLPRVGSVASGLLAVLARELDYANEAKGQRAFAAAFSGDPDFRIPAVVAQAGACLVTEWLGGSPLVAVARRGTRAERDRASLLLFRFALAAPARCGLVHLDPDPANFRLMPDGRLGVLDFGAVGPPHPSELGALLRTAAGGRLPRIVAAARAHGFAPSGTDADLRPFAALLRSMTAFVREDAFAFSPRWVADRVGEATAPAMLTAARHLALPQPYLQTAHVMPALLAVLGALGGSGSFRDEAAAYLPGFA
ncbi:AarF/UbiB family protein [Actinocorallia sp. A-T 12471]|uniref:AarF/UbiB family protein n=1 Tax=Actinocorallia sp. A-T 12471 TaxID=3089813 RepID=UPI0029CCD57F|nr:AarF/UbiB family protein [Actinocorallia sp. A-T 12471]MDX6744397.1 AarF/UbiB family protein [Actinocorallia sp. A-T 12471]